MSVWKPEIRYSANPVRTLWDAAVQHYNLRFTCWNCKRSAVFHAAALWWHFNRKGWFESLTKVQARMRCSGCGMHLPELKLVMEKETDHSLPLPDDREWKQESRRRR